jgi:hypothetical protein
MPAWSYLEGKRKLADQWRRLLGAFIASLPAHGWEGSVKALEYALWSVAERHPDLRRAFVPRGTGLGRQLSTSAEDIRRAGWAVRIRRSRRTGRTFVFERAGGEGSP